MSSPRRSRIAVLGAGAWGTALALHASRTGHPTTLWARDPARAAAMAATRGNPHLPGIALPDTLHVTANAAAALAAADFALLAIPAQHLAATLDTLPPLCNAILCAKGVEQGTLRLPLETLAAHRPGTPAAILSGPNFAGEIAAGLPAAAVLASDHAALRHAAAEALSAGAFRLYEGDDPIGAQLGGAAKNVVAIGAGAVIGAGLGENARAALVTRGLAEITRLALALGGRAETIAGLSGLGDLLLTCTGPGSRNFSLGVALGRGQPLAAILATRDSVTEGVATAPALLARARAVGVELPICAAVAGVLNARLSIAAAMQALLVRPRRAE